jgi:hypothetical protein
MQRLASNRIFCGSVTLVRVFNIAIVSPDMLQGSEIALEITRLAWRLSQRTLHWNLECFGSIPMVKEVETAPFTCTAI